MLKKRTENERAFKSSKLQTVFTKLSGVLPKAQEIGTSNKMMVTDIIESVLTDGPVPADPTICNYDLFSVPDEKGQFLTVNSLAHCLETELRLAKRTHLLCGEVLLPCGLLHRISCDILSMAESEPCGIRGCLIYLNLEILDESKKISSLKCDPGTTTTFEVNLTLKQDSTGWNFIPQFFKNFRRCGTIVLSPAYILSKKKLYRTVLE